VASVGVAPNKFLAKLASDHKKPDGFLVLRPEEVTAFLTPLPVGRMWGVGAKGEKRLHALGIRTIGQLAAFPEQVLVDQLGEPGGHMWRLAQGKDDRTVVPDRDAQSISTETTFAHDLADRDALRTWLLDLVDHLAGRLRRQGVRARAVELKVRSATFRTRSRSQVLPEATNVTSLLWRTAAELLERSLTDEVLPVRLLGVGATRLTRDAVVQGDLFDGPLRERQGALDQAVDDIRTRFGTDSLQRGSLINRTGHGLDQTADP
jgi:DNA polymerase-4